jgi:hypothetical protein
LVHELGEWGIKRSRSWVFQHLHLAGLDPQVQAMVARGQVPIAAVNVLYTKSADEQLRIAAGLADGSLRLADAGLEARPTEAIHGEINDRLAKAGSLAGGRPPTGRRTASADGRHGVVQTRRLLLGIDDPDALTRLTGARASRPRRKRLPEDWTAQASDEERSLAREAFHLGGLSPDQALVAADRWQREAETAPDDLLMAAHGMKRVIDLYARSAESLARYPGLMNLLRMRAGVLTSVALLAEEQAARR